MCACACMYYVCVGCVCVYACACVNVCVCVNELVSMYNVYALGACVGGEHAINYY